MNSLSSHPNTPASEIPAQNIQTQNIQSVITFVEKAYSVICWLYFCNGLETVLGQNDLLIRPLRYVVLSMSILFLVLRWQTTLRTLSKGLLLWPIIALMIGSFAWSISPDYTTDSIKAEVLPMTFFAIYFAGRFNMREQIRIMAITLGIGAVLSMFYALAIPSIGRHVGGEFDGAWKGIYAQKNSFSTTMTLTMMLFFVLSISNQAKEKRLARIGLAFSMMMIILSTSKSGLIVFIAMLMIVVSSRLFRWRGRRSVLFLDLLGLGFLALGSFLSVTWRPIVIALGKDPTLSARTPIWAGAIEKIMQRPLLGYGRAAFWTPDSLPAWEVGARAVRGLVPAHAHNGFIDVAIELGLVGFGIFVLGLIPTFVMAVRRAYKATEPEDLWPFVFLILMVLSNLTETALINRISPYWVMYLVTFLSLRIWPRRTALDAVAT